MIEYKLNDSKCRVCGNKCVICRRSFDEPYKLLRDGKEFEVMPKRIPIKRVFSKSQAFTGDICGICALILQPKTELENFQFKIVAEEKEERTETFD